MPKPGDTVRFTWKRTIGDEKTVEGSILESKTIGGRDFWIVSQDDPDHLTGFELVPKDAVLESEVIEGKVA